MCLQKEIWTKIAAAYVLLLHLTMRAMWCSIRVWNSRLRLGSPSWEVVQMYQTHHPVAGPAGLAGEETEVMSLYRP